MPNTKNTRLINEKTSALVRNILNIEDTRISFSEKPFQKKRIKGRLANLFTGTLRDTPRCCPCCGCVYETGQIIHYGHYQSTIQLIPYQEVPTYLLLYTQRFFCNNCGETFSPQSSYVEPNCVLSRTLKFAIAVELKHKISMKDIASRYFVSVKSVERILESFYSDTTPHLEHLPRHVLIDEFKGTKDCEGAMCFIISNADNGKIFDILDDRRNFKLKAYFMRFTLKARRQVKHIVMDMNASYNVITRELFPEAKISIDRFHVIQQLTRAFNKQRIQVMNSLSKSDSTAQKDYRKLKKYWRTLLKKNRKINYQACKAFPLFQKKQVTESEVLDYLLSISPELKLSYDVYQDLLEHFENKDAKAFFQQVEHLPQNLNQTFKKAILYLLKHKKAIYHALNYAYSNGKLEGKNRLIKVIQSIAFGFRTFKHLRLRIFIQQGLFEINTEHKKRSTEVLP